MLSKERYFILKEPLSIQVHSNVPHKITGNLYQPGETRRDLQEQLLPKKNGGIQQLATQHTPIQTRDPFQSGPTGTF